MFGLCRIFKYRRVISPNLGVSSPQRRSYPQLNKMKEKITYLDQNFPIQLRPQALFLQDSNSQLKFSANFRKLGLPGVT